MTLLVPGPGSVMAQDVQVTVKPDQDFSKFRSYAWGENMIAPAQLPEERKQTEQWIIDAVNQQLERKKYTENAENPDFLIQVRAMAIPGSNVSSANADVRLPNLEYRHESNRPLGAGVSIWMSFIAGVRITATDAASGEVAWEAVLKKEYKDPDKLNNNLKKEIDKFFKKGLKKFPSNKNRK